MTPTETAFLRAVRRGDERAVEAMRDELREQGYTREQIRDLWEIFGVSIGDKLDAYEAAQRRQHLAELA